MFDTSQQYMNGSDPNCHTFKLVFIGDSGVGKTCLVERAVKNSFTDNINYTIGAAFQKYTLKTEDNVTVTYNIWDTAGQERYRSLGPIYYRGSNAAILVYDITKSESFENIESWIYNLKTILGSDILMALVGMCLRRISLLINHFFLKMFCSTNVYLSYYRLFCRYNASSIHNFCFIFLKAINQI